MTKDRAIKQAIKSLQDTLNDHYKYQQLRLPDMQLFRIGSVLRFLKESQV